MAKMKRRKFLGIDVKTFDESDPEQVAEMRKDGHVAIHMCVRVEDSDPDLAWPELRARMYADTCPECGHRIWIDPKSKPKCLIVVSLCNQCVMRRVIEKGLGPRPIAGA